MKVSANGREPNHGVVVAGVVLNEKGEILISKRGQGASCYRGRYEIPGGHVETGEGPMEAFLKEMKEELCIDLKKEDVEFVTTIHAISKELMPYMNIVYKIVVNSSDISIGEPKKCEEQIFVSYEDLSNYNILKHNMLAIDSYFNGVKFTEIKYGYV